MAAPHPEPVTTNRPGDLTCPRWLFELDDPAPARVILAAGVPDAVPRWFHDAGATVEVLDPYRAPLPPPAPLLVLDDGLSGRAGRPLQDVEWLRGTGAVVLVHGPDRGWAQALRAAGLGRIRPVQADSSHRRSTARVHLATPGAGTDLPSELPAWLRALAAPDGGEMATARWSLRVPDAYPSQKAIARVPTGDGDGEVVVKLTRHPRFNERLGNEAATLDAIARHGGPIAGRVPRVLATGEVAGLRAVAQQAVPGEPFLARAALRAGCPYADDAVAAIGDLASVSLRGAADERVSSGLERLLDRFIEGHAPPPAVADHLARQVAILVDRPPPSVLFHGDLGTWNLWVDPCDHVWILDWESAEVAGPPLWDLLYFLRSLAVRSGRRRGLTRHQAIGRHLLGSSPLALQAARWVHRYRDRLGLEPEVVEALLHTCWMHRAVKERNRLSPSDPGHYGPLCIRMVDQREAPGLRRLVGR